MKNRLKLLVLCTGNSCRSQMAEGLVRSLKGDQIEINSAGTEPKDRVHPLAVRAMKEIGIDISAHHPKHLNQFLNQQFDYVWTVCDEAHEACPVFPGKAKLIHVSFEDPPRLAANAKTDDQAMVHFRRVRDQIKEFVQRLPTALTERE